jgi:hypothetical protein
MVVCFFYFWISLILCIKFSKACSNKQFFFIFWISHIDDDNFLKIYVKKNMQSKCDD